MNLLINMCMTCYDTSTASVCEPFKCCLLFLVELFFWPHYDVLVSSGLITSPWGLKTTGTIIKSQWVLHTPQGTMYFCVSALWYTGAMSRAYPTFFFTLFKLIGGINSLLSWTSSIEGCKDGWMNEWKCFLLRRFYKENMYYNYYLVYCKK